MPAVKPAVNIVTRDGKPALNVKVGLLIHWPDAKLVAAKYDVSEHDAETMLSQLWDIGVTEFWRDAETLADTDFGNRAQVFSDGRSGGWLVVHGLGDVAEWTPKERKQWARFAAAIQHVITARSGAKWAHETLAELAERMKEDARAERIRDAAPALLAALHALVTEADRTGGNERTVSRYEVDRARVVIAQAEGTT